MVKCLTDENIIEILKYLTPQELLFCVSLVDKWMRVISLHDSLWIPLVERALLHKCYVPTYLTSLLKSSARLCFIAGIQEAQRCFLTSQELTSFTWSFRFKSTAGESWLAMCPWNQGRAATTVKFLEDGTLRIQRPPVDSDEVPFINEAVDLKWALKTRQRSRRRQSSIGRFEQFQKVFHTSNLFTGSIPTSSANSGNTACYSSGGHSPTFVGYQRSSSSTENDSPYQHKRCRATHSDRDSSATTSSHDGTVPYPEKKTHLGDCVIIMVNGIEAPSYHIYRSPTDNWGFVLESCWAICECAALEDNQLKVSVESQWIEVQQYNRKMMQQQLLDA